MPEKFFVLYSFVKCYHSLYFAIRCLGNRIRAAQPTNKNFPFPAHFLFQLPNTTTAAPLSLHQHFSPHFPCYTNSEICNKVYMIFLFQDKVRTAQPPTPAEFLSNFADIYTVYCVIMPLKSFLHLIIWAYINYFITHPDQNTKYYFDDGERP